MGVILNKPTLSVVATSGNYNDLSNKPVLDNEPIQNSTNAITSGAVYSILGQIEEFLHNLNSGS